MIIVLVIGLWTFLRAVLFGAATIALEHVALRHQLAVLQPSGRRPLCRSSLSTRSHKFVPGFWVGC
jgi:hypothetical protein